MCTPANDMTGRKAYFFSMYSLRTLASTLRGGNFRAEGSIGMGAGKGMHVSCVVSRSGGFITTRLFHFVPCACRPTSSIFCFAKSSTDTFMRYLRADRF